MEKNIYWVNSEGRLIKGIATLNLDDGFISLANDRSQVFELLEVEQIHNGTTLQEIFEEIPEDITNYNLGGRA